MVQRTGVRGINRYGRAAQGVKVMNIRDEDKVSAVALVVETQADDAEAGALSDAVAEQGPIEHDASGGTAEAGPQAPDEHAPDPDAMLSDDAAKASEAALDPESEHLDEPDEVDLDETDGPPTPDA
jgi:DNA gyrase subunit A